MNSRLLESLPNITELYRLFILSSISQCVNTQIEYYSDLQGEDENTFKQLVTSSCQSIQQNISEQSSFGLVKSNSSGVNTFIHPSIKEYFEALHRCNTEIKDDPFWEIYLFLAGLPGQKKFWYNKCFDFIHYSYEQLQSTLLLHWLLFESQSLSPVIESAIVVSKTDEGFSLEADPLEWYIAGWCLQNIQIETNLICDVPYSFNRAFCLEMLYNGTKHDPASNKCKGRLTQISLNGDSQLSECLQWLTQMQVLENVLTFKIMGTLRSSVESLNLDTYFPSLKTLDVTSHEVFSSVRQQLTISLPKLKHLTTLCIRTSQTSEFPSVKSDMLVSLADSIKTCRFLKILMFEGMSSQFLEFALTISSNDPIASSLQSLHILSSQCSDKLVMELKCFLVLTNCKLEQLILACCSIDPSSLGNLLNTILASALEDLVILGEETVGKEGALEIAKAIENAECKLDHHQIKYLVLHDAHIPGQEALLILKAVQKHDGYIILNLLPKYRYDFENHEFVQFNPNQHISLILQKFIEEFT